MRVPIYSDRWLGTAKAIVGAVITAAVLGLVVYLLHSVKDQGNRLDAAQSERASITSENAKQDKEIAARDSAIGTANKRLKRAGQPTVPVPKTTTVTGEQGIPGLPGIGVRGPRGFVGPIGPAGKDSTVPGPGGAAGANGKDSNVPGPAGPAGKDGADGTDGAPGADGQDAPTITGLDCTSLTPSTQTIHLSNGTSYTAECTTPLAP